MLKKRLFFVVILLTLMSCQNEMNDDIYKTKSGEYASKAGNFIVDFPIEPDYKGIDNQIGLDKFKLHLFQSDLGPNKIFTIQYFDYPEHMMKSLTTEQLYEQSINNFSNKMSESFKLEFKKPIEQHGLNGLYFVLRLKPEVVKKGVKGYIEGEFFIKGNRFYTITYTGHQDNNIDPFMKSFRLLNKN